MIWSSSLVHSGAIWFRAPNFLPLYFCLSCTTLTLLPIILRGHFGPPIIVYTFSFSATRIDTQSGFWFHISRKNFSIANITSLLAFLGVIFREDRMSDKDLVSQNRAIIDVKEDWPWWQRLFANIINASGVFFWAIVSIIMIKHFGNNPELVGLRNAYLNLVVVHTVYVIFSMVAALTLVSWLMPFFHPSKIMRTGTTWEKVACMVFWGLLSMAIGISLLSVA